MRALLSLALAESALQPHRFEIRGDVAAVPDAEPLVRWFAKYTQVFGVYLFATKDVSDDALNHATNIMAQFLDNDQDGQPDRPEAVKAMASRNAMMAIFTREGQYESSEIKKFGEESADSALRHYVTKDDEPWWTCKQPLADMPVWVYAELWEAEMKPGRVWEGNELEEVFHLYSHVGLGCTEADLAPFRGSALAASVETAVGDCGYPSDGTFRYRRSDPQSCSGRFHYDDPTCTFPCLCNELLWYAYGNKLRLDAGKAPRCDSDFYKACTPTEIEATDPGLAKLISDPRLPKVLPDGNYQPAGATSFTDTVKRELRYDWGAALVASRPSPAQLLVLAIVVAAGGTILWTIRAGGGMPSKAEQGRPRYRAAPSGSPRRERQPLLGEDRLRGVSSHQVM